MISSLPTGRRGQALAAALTVVLLAAIWVAVVDPLLATYADRAQSLIQQRALARRMADLVATLPDLQRQEAAETTEQTPADAVLSGASDGVAGAELLQKVQDMASTAGVSLASVDTLPAQQQGAYRRIAVRVSLSAPYPVVVRLLAAIRQAVPRMLIDQLDLQAVQALVHQDDLPIQTSFTIFAFCAGAPPPATPQ